MENTPAAAPSASKTTPRDFFFWAGLLVALIGSVISLTTLLFSYINFAFPDPLAYYGDPYGSDVRIAMACVIVFIPTALVLVHLIRKTIINEAGKANIWVRRWALGLILFVSTVTILIDLITLIMTFLGGELSIRFGLKVTVVLLVAAFLFLHFLADLKGYWLENVKKAGLVSSAVLAMALVSVVAGFFIIGTPGDIRLMRFDEQKVMDLQNIQYQVVNYYQQKEELPESLAELSDPLSGFVLPVDQQPGATGYRYTVTGPLSFELCAVFNKPTPDTRGQGGYPARDMSYPSPGMGVDENWQHEAGDTCFTRTIDPERYPIFEKPLQ